VIVISPWSKPHYVSHVKRDYTAILKFIETRFGIPSLTARDAAQDDMEEFFNFSAVQIPSPPALPVQPTSGVCNKNLEKAPGF
jgi:phospholipase C